MKEITIKNRIRIKIKRENKSTENNPLPRWFSFITLAP